MKRILQIITGNEHGGVAQSSRLLFEGILKDATIDVKVVCLCRGDFAHELRNRYGGRITVFPHSVPPIVAATGRLRRMCNRVRLAWWFLTAVVQLICCLLRTQVDVVHTTNNYALPVCCVCRIFFGFRLISHWRCIGVRRQWLLDWLTSHVDQFICISHAVKDSLPLAWQEKAVVVYNGVDVSRLKRGGEQCRGKLRNYLEIGPQTLLFGTIGSYTDIKCHDLLIETCRLLKSESQQPFRCVLIGSAPNESSKRYLTYLKQKTEQYGLTSEVVFLNDHELDVPAYVISDFDFFVGSTWFNGRGEGFGLMYIEAMAQGLPLIAIEVGAAVELIHPDTGLLVKDNSPSLHKDAILSLISNRERMQTMGVHARKEVEKYDIQFTVHQITRLYQ